MKKIKLIFSVFVSLLVLSGCGTNSKEDPLAPPVVSVNGYSFNNATSHLLIDSYKRYKIEFQLTSEGFAVEGQSVSFKVFDNNYGSVSPSSVLTDASGKGSFIYTPPTVMPADGTKFTIVYSTVADLNFDGSPKFLSQNVELEFNLDASQTDKGKATTLSITYEGTICDQTEGLKASYHIHAVDSLSNLPLRQIPFSFSLINGVKEINGRKVQVAKGDINNTAPISFMDHSVNFDTQTEVEPGDNLIIFPSINKTDLSYLGGWTIENVFDRLTLQGLYPNLEETKDLTYIIGNENRFLGDTDGSAGRLGAAHIEEISSTTDVNGYAYFDVVFDPVLAGHTVTVEAHGTNAEGNRVGISQRIALRTDDIGASTTNFSAKLPPLAAVTKTKPVHISVDAECFGSEPVIDVPINMSAFSVSDTACTILSTSTQVTDGSGNVYISVRLTNDDNETEQDISCDLEYERGASSIYFEY